jgi:DNA-directed RNA polymerase specialized sigma24 family protein
VRRDVEGRVSAVSGDEHTAVGLQVAESLIEEIRPVLARYGVGTETVARAFEEARVEVGASGKDRKVSRQELRSTLFGLVLWKIFGRRSAPWISSKTEAGHEIPHDVLVAAYSMWEGLVDLAARHGVDTAAAAEALTAATHATADKLACSGEGTEGDEIRDVRNYLLTSYVHRISYIAGKQGSTRTDYVDMESWVLNRKLSDKRAFLHGLENEIYCREFLDAMPAKAKSVAIARYVLGYTWPETAEALDSSVNAAQKALSSGVRIAIATCQKVRRAWYLKPVNIEIGKLRRKKASF